MWTIGPWPPRVNFKGEPPLEPELADVHHRIELAELAEADAHRFASHVGGQNQMVQDSTQEPGLSPGGSQASQDGAVARDLYDVSVSTAHRHRETLQLQAQLTQDAEGAQEP